MEHSPRELSSEDIVKMTKNISLDLLVNFDPRSTLMLVLSVTAYCIQLTTEKSQQKLVLDTLYVSLAELLEIENAPNISH